MESSLISCRLQWRRTHRLLFLVFLAVFATAPILDAYLDSVSSCSPVDYQESNDSNDPVVINDLKSAVTRNLRFASNRSSKWFRDDQTRARLVSRINGPAGSIIKPQLPANDSCSSQRCSFVSSDPSPPVI